MLSKRGDGFSEPVIDGLANGFYRLFRIVAGCGYDQGLPPAGTEADDPGETGRRYRIAIAVLQADANVCLVLTGFLYQLFGGPGV